MVTGTIVLGRHAETGRVRSGLGGEASRERYLAGSDSVPQSFDNGKASSGSLSFAAVTQDAGLTWHSMSLPEPPAAQLRPGEPPDVFMSLSSLDCPRVNVCIAMANTVAGNKHAAIYTTAP